MVYSNCQSSILRAVEEVVTTRASGLSYNDLFGHRFGCEAKGLGSPPATCFTYGITLSLDVAGRTDFIFGMAIPYVWFTPKILFWLLVATNHAQKVLSGCKLAMNYGDLH
jgi:hypothetical protein